MEENNNGSPTFAQCATCRRRLDQGVDAIAIQHGVIGPRGFIPLDDPQYLCGEECVQAFFNGAREPDERLRRRIP